MRLILIPILLACVPGINCLQACTPSVEAGLVVVVRDQQTGQPIGNAVVTASDGTYSETLEVSDPAGGVYRGAYERAGTYTVLVEADGFFSRTIENVKVELYSDGCHVKTVELDVELSPHD